MFAVIMYKSEIFPMPGYYDGYINLVQDDDLFIALDKSLELIENYDVKMLEDIGDRVYQPGKWTIKDIFQHMIDTERIFDYRALRFARHDSTPLPPYDEESYGKYSMAVSRDMTQILDELKQLRRSTIQLFRSFHPSVFQNSGTFFNQQVSVLAIGFIIIGHQVHHLNIIKERYAPLIKS